MHINMRSEHPIAIFRFDQPNSIGNNSSTWQSNFNYAILRVLIWMAPHIEYKQTIELQSLFGARCTM